MALIATYPLMTVSTQQATRSKRLQAQLPSHKKEKANAFGTIEDIAEVCNRWLTITCCCKLWALPKQLTAP